MIKPANTPCLGELWVGEQSTWEIYGYFSFPACHLPGASRVQEKIPWLLPGKLGIGSANTEQLFLDDRRKSCTQLFHLVESTDYTEV